eukprot:PLAT3021.1.p1 GENE.PLAT3021.1~~PLAT3021.1.p1  ORF type:complete len:427 (+),score=231.44 PLAT3021.1:51-1331(+)
MAEEVAPSVLDKCVADTDFLGGVRAEGEESDEASAPSLLMHLIKKLRPGQDLSRVLIPAFYLEPRSILEKFTDIMMHPELILDVASVEDDLERFMTIVRWFLSGWHYKTTGVKKPYNSIIGETCAAMWQHEDSRSYYFAEQVSHHPPISALYFENRAKHIVFNAQVQTKSRFGGNSAASIMAGGATMYLLNRPGEVYNVTFPNFYAIGLFMGKLRMELGDKSTITCPSLNLEAEFEWKLKPTFGGSYNAVNVVIKRDGTPVKEISGKWDGEFKVKDAGKRGSGDAFLDVTSLPVAPKMMLPVEEAGRWESRRLWSKVTERLRSSPPDWDGADDEKGVLEQAQRELPCHDKKAPVPWETKKFHLVDQEHPVTGETEKMWIFDDLNLEDDGEERDLVSMSYYLADPRDADADAAEAAEAAEEEGKDEE